MSDAFNLSPIEFIREKIRRNELETENLKRQYKALTGVSYSPTDTNNLNADYEGNFTFPSKSELETKIISFLESRRELVKTSSLVDHYYPNLNNKELRTQLIRRFSGALTTLKDEGKVYGQKVKGEKGDVYTVYKELFDEE